MDVLNKPGISVVIACYNSASVIKETLLCLQNQIQDEHISWEVILVDNNCTDATSQIALETWSHSRIPLRIIEEKTAGEAVARKTGFKAAQYQILSIVDDDNRVPPHWIATLNTFFENKEIGLVGTVGEGSFETSPPDWFEDFKNAFAIGSLYSGDFTDITADAIVPGAGMSLRKEILDKLYAIDWKPFLKGRVGHIQSAGADSELCYITRHLGYKIYYSNSLIFKHFTKTDRITWERLCNMFRGFGASDVFTLPYKISYAESQGKNSFLQNLRKKWWFNYAAKILILVFKYGPFSSDSKHKQLMKLRTAAFCEAIMAEKKQFEGAFVYLENLKKGLSK
jgi:glycosyltransferase involved in cell wall biosynthesis